MIKMAGYRHKPKIYRLVFEDEEYKGLEVMVRSLPIGEFLSLAKLQENLDDENPDVREVEKLFALFADKLIGWNLEDEDGGKVPSNLSGVKTLDMDFFLAMVNAWIQGMSGVPKELGKDSISGGTSLEDLIPTVPLSESLQS